jgi:hypothetical protein
MYVKYGCMKQLTILHEVFSCLPVSSVICTMCVCVCVYIYIYIYIYTHTHTRTHIYTHTHTCIYIYAYIHVYVCIIYDNLRFSTKLFHVCQSRRWCIRYPYVWFSGVLNRLCLGSLSQHALVCMCMCACMYLFTYVWMYACTSVAQTMCSLLCDVAPILALSKK